jgi:hypothetical protein
MGHLGGRRRGIFSFCNADHVDGQDRLSKPQVKEWSDLADYYNWSHCYKLLLQDHFCLPTTCGYQFVYDKDAKTELSVDAFFAMNGLGLAMRIEHGIGHHFMGAMFAHNTCLPVCYNASGQVTVSNKDDNFQIIGWGTSGGFREVSEARNRQSASAEVSAANARVSEAEARVSEAEEEVQRLRALIRAQGLEPGIL